MSVTDWPPPYENEVAAPAGEQPLNPASTWISNTKPVLDWSHKALQVLFMGLALIGLVLLLGSNGPRSVLRGAAKKHAVA